MYTMEDFKSKKIAVTFQSADEQKKFLTACEKSGMVWIQGQKASGYIPHAGSAITLNGSSIFGKGLGSYTSAERAKAAGQTIVPASAFDFMQAIPFSEIHITSDGKVTHGIYKENGKVIKRTTAVCMDGDVYKFFAGADVAFRKITGEYVKPKAGIKINKNGIKIVSGKIDFPVTPNYDEVKRQANVGEHIKVVKAHDAKGKYNNGEILEVSYLSLAGCVIGWKYKGELIVGEICSTEYVVLVPKP